MTIPTAAMKREKDEAFNRGKQAALDELASGAGFSGSADLITALQKLKAAPAPTAPAAVTPAPQAPAPSPDADPAKQLETDRQAHREEGRFQRQLEKVLSERNRYAQSASDWQKKAKEFQAEADAVRAEMHLRTIAAQCGVQDIDYAIALFSRDVERLTPEQAQTFDEKAFFEGLRKTKPLLFGEAVVPAHTGTSPGGPGAPPPNKVTQQQTNANKTDVRKMDPKSYGDELRRRGITPG